LLAMGSLLIVAIYPFMKRITHWPQAVLGLAFNWGALVGWSATHGSLGLPAFLLYGGGIFWTLAYDTIYAHQDKDDDVLIGVKSTALLFGANTKPWLGFFFLTAGLLIAASLFMAGAGWFAYAGLAAAALHGLWQITSFDHSNSNHCLKLFRANRMLGLLLAAGLLMDLIIQ
jgi:4-hydroxybenzoate polyprenyltransferase